MKNLLAWSCFIVLAMVLVQADEKTLWVQHKNIYTTKTEQELREKIFNDNVKDIEEHNKKYELGLVSYKKGINQFTDLTNKEFASRFKSMKADEETLHTGEVKYDLTSYGMEPLPESIDWRTKSVVTEVKDQGSCGGCWAFSATGTIESQLAIQTGELKSLSEQELLDCDTHTRNQGCDGGVVQAAIYYVSQNGLSLEKNYPYQASQKNCRKKKSVVKADGYVNIMNEDDLKRAVGLIGPVSIAINANPIQLYAGGIFNDTCSDNINHAVLAVGYGKDKKGGEYWIIKNSWGKSWGEDGYFKMVMGRNLCGINTQACYPTGVKASGCSINEYSLGYILVYLLAKFFLLVAN